MIGLRARFLREAEDAFADDVALHLCGAAGDASGGRAEDAERRVVDEHAVGAGDPGSEHRDVEHHLGDAQLHE